MHEIASFVTLRPIHACRDLRLGIETIGNAFYGIDAIRSRALWQKCILALVCKSEVSVREVLYVKDPNVRKLSKPPEAATRR